MQNADSLVDAIGGVFFNGQLVKIDCISLYPNPSDSKQVSTRLVGRIALTPNTALQLRDLLIKLFNDLESKKNELESKKNE